MAGETIISVRTVEVEKIKVLGMARKGDPGAPGATPTPALLGALGVPVVIEGVYPYDAATLAAIAAALAAGWPESSIIVRIVGPAGPTDALVSVPTLVLRTIFAPPLVTGAVLSDAPDALVTAPTFILRTIFAPPAVSGQQAALVSVPAFTLRTVFTPPFVSGAVLADSPDALVMVPTFILRTVFTPPAVDGQQAALVAVPNLISRIVFAPPVVTGEVTGASGPTLTLAATISLDDGSEGVDGAWATVRNATDGETLDSDDSLSLEAGGEYFYYEGSEQSNWLYWNTRMFISFDVPSGAAYSTAEIGLTVTAFSAAGRSLYAAESNHGAAVTIEDYDNFPGAPNGTSFGESSAINATGDKTITLNASGLAYLNGIRATGGTAQFVIRHEADFENDTAKFTGIGIAGATAVEANRPRLVVT